MLLGGRLFWEPSRFSRWFVQSSFQLPPDAVQPCESFNDQDAAQLPTRLAIHFAAPADLVESRLESRAKYIYEVSFRSEIGKPKSIVSKSLRQASFKGGKPVRLFERDEKSEIRYGKGYGLAGYRQVLSKVRSNSSVIATLAQFDHPPSLLLQGLAACTSAIFGFRVSLESIDLNRLVQM
jgi:hypothetical protein